MSDSSKVSLSKVSLSKVSSNENLVRVKGASKKRYERWVGGVLLEDLCDKPISSYLDVGPERDPETDFKKLPSMSDGICYQGNILRGEYFLHVEPDETLADAIARVPKSERSSLFAYLNNQELVQQPRPEPSRIAIDFFDDLEEVGLASATSTEQLAWLRENRPMLLSQLETTAPGADQSVYTFRTELEDNKKNAPHREFWWLFAYPRLNLKRLIKPLTHVIAFGAVSKVWTPSYLSMREDSTGLGICPSHRLFISPIQSSAFFGVLTSFAFEMHARREASTIGTGMNITPTDSVTVFPMPWRSQWCKDEGRPWIGDVSDVPKNIEESLGSIVDKLLAHRQMILDDPIEHGVPESKINSQWGPTNLYNLYDDQEQTFEAIEILRSLHRDLFASVLRAYGWDDLVGKVSWGFEYPWIDRTMRYVPDQVTRAALFERLGDLNQARYKEELALYRPFVENVLRETSSRSLDALRSRLSLVGVSGVSIAKAVLADVLELIDKESSSSSDSGSELTLTWLF